MSVASQLRSAELDPRTLGVLLALAAIWVGLDLATDGLFLTARNLYNLAVQSSVVGVMASGMVLVITARHIDLSVGSVLGVTGMTIAMLQASWLPPDAAWAWPVSVLLGVGMGAGIGAWQGWWVAYRGVPAFVVTLGGLLMFRGAAWLVADGKTITPLAPGFEVLGGGVDGSIGATASWALGGAAVAIVAWVLARARSARRRHGFPARPVWADALRFGAAAAAILGVVLLANSHLRPGGNVGRGVPVPVLIWASSVLGVAILFRATRFGRYVTAIGGSPLAAERAGIDVRRVTLLAFSLMGGLAAIAAVITTARLGAGTNSIGTLAELNVIAAAVIGGTSLSGGRGRVAGAALGAILMQSLENGMVLLGVESAARQVAIGAILITAVWLDRLGTDRESRA